MREVFRTRSFLDTITLVKHLSLLLLMLAYALSACTAELPAPVTAFPATPVATAVPSASPTVPSAVAPAPSPTIEPRYLGSLTPQQRESLAAAAQAYLSPTPAEALATAQRLDYIGRNANPATMCGPLALAILQDAGIVDPAIRLIDFWYLDPRPAHDEKFLQTVFPPERFEKIAQQLPLNQVDYAANPLYPGDFLYLFAGDSGSFEHMLVVSRVDDAGRAYAVTNLNTADGVVVQEVMLYDPAHPGVGQFYEWTDWENRTLGRTGYGGFWLWRPLESASG